jgi:rhodanese-related sulfurtransferase
MQDIFPNEVGQWQERGARIIDVREPTEFAGGHLPGAVNIPLADLTLLPELSATPVVVVCASGGRSARAAALLEGAGHLEVANLLGGTYGWMGENRPVEFTDADDRH